MNIKNLKTGQTFKNYKALCAELEMEAQSGTSKKAQFKELERFCSYNKIGHKIYIEEVYDTPIPKVENRGKSAGSRNNNSIYGDMIQLLILDLLAQCKGGHVSISRSKLMLTISMINQNYGACGELVQKLAEYTDIEEAIIYDFYNTSNSNFKKIVERALNNLMDKRIIWFDRVTKIAEKYTRTHRLATDDEKEIIVKCEKKILDKLGYKQVSQVRVSKHWRLFKKEVKKLLCKESEIEYYYLAYDIIVNEEYLQEERKELTDLLLEELEREEYKGELNTTVYNNLINNAEERHKKGFTTPKMSVYRLKDEYVSNIRLLADLLISDEASIIVENVINIELLNDNVLEENIIANEDLEGLFG